ncbi:unnamed protein product, partial [Ectocarpus sp. 4 AP-2014]
AIKKKLQSKTHTRISRRRWTNDSETGSVSAAANSQQSYAFANDEGLGNKLTRTKSLTKHGVSVLTATYVPSPMSLQGPLLLPGNQREESITYTQAHFTGHGNP